jgi:hypothetical protein
MLRRFISYASTTHIVEVGDPQGAGGRDGGTNGEAASLERSGNIAEDPKYMDQLWTERR